MLKILENNKIKKDGPSHLFSLLPNCMSKINELIFVIAMIHEITISIYLSIKILLLIS